MRVGAYKQANFAEFGVHRGDVGFASGRIRRGHQFLRDIYLAVFEQNLSPVVDEQSAVEQSPQLKFLKADTKVCPVFFREFTKLLRIRPGNCAGPGMRF